MEHKYGFETLAHISTHMTLRCFRYGIFTADFDALDMEYLLQISMLSILNFSTDFETPR